MSEMPDRIGRYQVRALLGRGGMGLVYRAHDPVIDRAVAIKLIHPALLGGRDGDAALALFRDEARAAGRCTHPHIVGLFDAALHEGRPFLVMEYVEGEDLSAALRRAGGRLPTGTAVAIAVQVLEALQAAHGQGVVHRDIKPSNVLLGRDGRARLSDFGIAHLASRGAGPGMAAGTPSYMSPEQCRGEAPDNRSDLFSVGVLLQEMLAGERPFGSGTPSGIMQALLHAEPRPLPPAGPGLPDALRAIVARSLSKARDARFGSAAEMAAALRECPGLPAPMPLPADGPDADETRLAPVLAVDGPGRQTSLPQATLRELQQVLTRYVGPIAGYLVREAARQDEDADALCASLARAIEAGDARERFSREARETLALAGTSAAWTQAELEQLRQALARHLGPVAGLLVRRGAGQASSLAALWQAMARHIEVPAEREAFLRRRPGTSA
jgi:eukaryotic-like serine/threonine-protein kinase